MTYRFLAAVLVAVAMVTQACAQAPDRLQKILAAGVLRVGTTMDTPVFSMRNAEGKLEGIDIDLLETLAPALGVRIEYVKMSFGSMLPDLAADKFDVAMSGMGRTYERARVATFSRPYMRYGKLMVIRSADRARFASLSDLDRPGIRIAYNQGGLNDRFANTMFKQATVVGFASNELATADLLAGKIDAQVSDFDGCHLPRAAQPEASCHGEVPGLQPDLRRDAAQPGRPDPPQLREHLARPARARWHPRQSPRQVARRHQRAAD